MKPSKIWANLGVEDLDRTTRFYTQLGFKPNGASNDLTSFFFGEQDFIIHFFRKSVLETNIKTPFIDAAKGSEIIFTLSCDSREETDQWAQEVTAAGGSILSGPEAFGDNYYGFVFADPDGHKFNVFHM